MKILNLQSFSFAIYHMVHTGKHIHSGSCTKDSIIAFSSVYQYNHDEYQSCSFYHQCILFFFFLLQGTIPIKMYFKCQKTLSKHFNQLLQTQRITFTKKEVRRPKMHTFRCISFGGFHKFHASPTWSHQQHACFHKLYNYTTHA